MIYCKWIINEIIPFENLSLLLLVLCALFRLPSLAFFSSLSQNLPFHLHPTLISSAFFSRLSHVFFPSASSVFLFFFRVSFRYVWLQIQTSGTSEPFKILVSIETELDWLPFSNSLLLSSSSSLFSSNSVSDASEVDVSFADVLSFSPSSETKRRDERWTWKHFLVVSNQFITKSCGTLPWNALTFWRLL